MTDPKVEEIRARLARATDGPWRATRASWERSFNDSSKWGHPEVWGIVAGKQTVHKNAGDFHPENAEYTVDEIDVVQIGYDRDYSSAEAAISREADANLIANAPTDIALLLTKLDEAEKEMHSRELHHFESEELLEAAEERERTLIAGVREAHQAFDHIQLRSGASGPGKPWIKINIDTYEAALKTLSRLLPSTPTECQHPTTQNKFGGATICADCNIVVGYWKDPQPRLSMTLGSTPTEEGKK